MANIQRALDAMTAIKGSPVNGATANKWIEYFYNVYGPIADGDGLPIGYADLTNEQKATFYINHLRNHHRQVRIGREVPAAVATAQQNTIAGIQTEADADLGTDE